MFSPVRAAALTMSSVTSVTAGGAAGPAWALRLRPGGRLHGADRRILKCTADDESRIAVFQVGAVGLVHIQVRFQHERRIDAHNHVLKHHPALAAAAERDDFPSCKPWCAASAGGIWTCRRATISPSFRQTEPLGPTRLRRRCPRPCSDSRSGPADPACSSRCA